MRGLEPQDVARETNCAAVSTSGIKHLIGPVLFCAVALSLTAANRNQFLQSGY